MGLTGNETGAPLRALGADSAGNVLPLAASAMLVIAALVGGGLDMSRGYKSQSSLQQACDAGVLAGRKAVTTKGFDTTAQAAAQKFFKANFRDLDQDTHNTVFTPSTPDDGITINATATSKLNTVLMKIFGFNEFNLTTTCTASMGIGNSDVTFVLDTTGSMGDTAAGKTPATGETSKIQDLRAAMKNFYLTLANAAAGSNARIRYAFVPYSQSVNVGRLIYDLDPAYLADTTLIQSRLALWETVVDKYITLSNTTTTATYTAWVTTETHNNSTSCTNAKPANSAWANNGPSTSNGPYATTNSAGETVQATTVTQPQSRTEYQCVSTTNKKYALQTRTGSRENKVTTYPTYKQQFLKWEYKPRSINTSVFKTFQSVSMPNGTSGVAQSSTWGGCIEERQTSNAATFSFSALTGMSPDLSDLNIDEAPDGTEESKWRPMWPQLAYRRYDADGKDTIASPTYSGGLASSTCPRAAKTLATMAQADFDAYADSLIAGGSTYHDLGLLWGGRISSPQGMWSDLVNLQPSNGATVSRHMIFMTDGIMDTTELAQTSYGIEFLDRRVTSDGSSAQNDARHTQRFRVLCDAVKAKGIRIWVVAFGTSLTNDLNYCASDQSAYKASDSAGLNKAFQSIAKQVGELRLTQ